jgi:hypothetical protein
MRKLSALAASMLLLGVLVASPATVAAAACTVPGDYATIQAAVNDPTCDPITVTGAYTEQVIVNRPVQIFGVAATVLGSFTVNAANVTIDGFTVNNPVPTATVGIVVKVAGSGSVISNNTLAQIGTSASPQPVVGIYLERGPDDVSVLDNDISFVFSDRSAQGILVGDSVSGDPSLNVLIEGNTISNITSASRGAYGIQINNGASTVATATGFTTGRVSDNTIDRLTGGGWAHAIGLEGPTPGLDVLDNDISNLVDLTPAVVNDATAVFLEANPDFDTVSINENNFNLTIAEFGIALHPTLLATAGDRVVDGTCNWWGSADGPGPVGPGTGARVTPNVDYEPWLIAPSGPCIGGLASTPGKVTGGGQIDDSDPLFSPLGDLISLPAILVSTNGSAKANFGFVIQLAEGSAAPKGNLIYHDQGADVRIKATSFDRLVIEPGICGPNTHATFTGTADVNGVSESLTVVVDDCGEPSSGPPPDMFSIDTDTYANGGPLVGGNIKIH